MDHALPYFIKFENERRFTKIPGHQPCKSCFPKFYDSQKYEIELNEGSCLFIPKYWFHMCFSEKANMKSGLNIALNTWFELNVSPLSKSEKEVLEEVRILSTIIPTHNECSSELLQDHSGNSFPFISKHTLSHDEFMNIETLKNLTVDRSKKVNVHSSLSNCFDSNFLTNPTTIMKQQTMELFLTKARQQQEMGKEFFYISAMAPKNEFSERLTPHGIREIANEHPIDVFTWINFGNVHTICHYDCRDNVISQIHGKKRIFLFPPFEIANLYPYNPYPLRFLETLKDNTSNMFFFQIQSLECFNLLWYINKQTSFNHFEESYEKYKPLYSFVFKSISSIVDHIPNVTITPVSPFSYMCSSDVLKSAFNSKHCMEIYRNEPNNMYCKSTFACFINKDFSTQIKFDYGKQNVVLEPFTLCVIKKDIMRTFSMDESSDLNVVFFDIGLRMNVIAC